MSSHERLRHQVQAIERTFGALIASTAVELETAPGSAFVAACSATHADLQRLAAQLTGTAFGQAMFPAGSDGVAFTLPLGLASAFLDGLIETGRGLEGVVALLAEQGLGEPHPVGQAAMSCIADFWAHSFVHLKLPLWRTFPELNPFLQAPLRAAGDLESATFRINAF